jgi:hypothetical protein
MDSAHWAILTPVLVAVIPVAGAIIPGLLSAPSSEKPEVTIEKEAGNWFSDPNSGSIKIKNIGGVTATNITVFVQSKSKILTVNVKGVVDITLPKFNNSNVPKYSLISVNSNSLEFKIPNLVQGDGGFTEIELMFDNVQNSEDLNVVGLYDQGSATGKTWVSTFIYYIVLAMIVVIIGEIIWFIYKYFIDRKRKLLKNISFNFLEIRKKLMNNPDNAKSLKSDWKSYPYRYIVNRNRSPTYFWDRAVPNSRKYVNFPDLIKIDDALTLLFRREDNLTSNQIRTTNYELLRSINEALTQVDWDKYT